MCFKSIARAARPQTREQQATHVGRVSNDWGESQKASPGKNPARISCQECKGGAVPQQLHIATAPQHQGATPFCSRGEPLLACTHMHQLANGARAPFRRSCGPAPTASILRRSPPLIQPLVPPIPAAVSNRTQPYSEAVATPGRSNLQRSHPSARTLGQAPRRTVNHWGARGAWFMLSSCALARRSPCLSALRHAIIKCCSRMRTPTSTPPHTRHIQYTGRVSKAPTPSAIPHSQPLRTHRPRHTSRHAHGAPVHDRQRN